MTKSRSANKNSSSQIFSIRNLELRQYGRGVKENKNSSDRKDSNIKANVLKSAKIQSGKLKIQNRQVQDCSKNVPFLT